MTSSVVGQNYLLQLWPELPGNYPSAGPSLLERLGVHASLDVISGKINYNPSIVVGSWVSNYGKIFLICWCLIYWSTWGEKVLFSWCLNVVCEVETFCDHEVINWNCNSFLCQVCNTPLPLDSPRLWNGYFWPMKQSWHFSRCYNETLAQWFWNQIWLIEIE